MQLTLVADCPVQADATAEAFNGDRSGREGCGGRNVTGYDHPGDGSGADETSSRRRSGDHGGEPAREGGHEHVNAHC